MEDNPKKSLDKLISEIFGADCDVSYYTHNNKKMIEFILEPGCNVSFKKLTELSELLGTDEIDFHNYTEDYRYSSWTYDPGEPTKIMCYNVKYDNK